jgi:hypothetical protein
MQDDRPISREEARYLSRINALPTQGSYNNIRSEAQAQYTGEFQPALRVTKKLFVHQQQPFIGTSTCQDDFKYWGNAQRKPSQLARGNNGIFDSNLPFNATSTAKSDFLSWRGAAPAKPAREVASRRDIVPDDRSFVTEASLQYDFKQSRPRPSLAPKVNAAASAEPFIATTTAQEDFRMYNAAPARSYQRQRTWRPRREDRSFTTEARGQFYEKDVPRMVRATKGGVRPQY